MDMFRKQEEQILAESRFQALVMAEKFFTTNNKGRSSCFERSFCEVASAEEQDEQQLALLSTVE